MRGIQCGGCGAQFQGLTAKATNRGRLSIQITCPRCKKILANPKRLRSRKLFLLCVLALIGLIAILAWVMSFEGFVKWVALAILFVLVSYSLRFIGIRNGYIVMEPTGKSSNSK